LRRVTLVLATALLAACAGWSKPEPGPDALAWLERQRLMQRLPAIGAVVVSSDEQLWLGATGRRSRAEPTPVTSDDRWHLGSITKSMTATLAARLVAEGLISFDTRVDEVLGDRFPTMHPGHRNTTLHQLLAHLGGLPDDLSRLHLWREPTLLHMTPAAQRDALLAEVLARPPASEPGKVFRYGNAAYVLAARMLEMRADEDWETLIARHLFDPLGLTSAGSGPPGSAAVPPEAPWGHRHAGARAAGQPMPPGPFADHPAALAPAGTVHMNLADLGRYLQLHLRGARGRPEFLPALLFERLHQPPTGHSYAAGWEIEMPAGHPLADLTHEGSNTLWFALVWISPGRDRAVAVVMNQVPRHPDTARRIAQRLLDHFTG